MGLSGFTWDLRFCTFPSVIHILRPFRFVNRSLNADRVRTSSSSLPFLQLSTQVWGSFTTSTSHPPNFQPHDNHMLPLPRTTRLHTTRSAPRQDLHTYTSIFVRSIFMLFRVSRLFDKVEKGILKGVGFVRPRKKPL
jgi:hypothetical protein